MTAPNQTPILITVTGPDKPGVSSVLFAVLSRHGVHLLDVEQVVIRGRLVLGVLVNAHADPEGLQEIVEQAMASVGMQVDVAQTVPEPVPQALTPAVAHREVGPRGRAGRRGRRLDRHGHPDLPAELPGQRGGDQDDGPEVQISPPDQ